jgi:hypothetical protein|tara:strand:+ start:505 stop:645 length:141 start_codon:yes stop_codon:yes gene_type:complete
LGQQGDVKEVLAHPFFKEMDFDKLIKRELVAEFIPKVENEGLNNFD